MTSLLRFGFSASTRGGRSFLSFKNSPLGSWFSKLPPDLKSALNEVLSFVDSFASLVF